MTHTTTIVSGFGERWTIRYDGMTGYATAVDGNGWSTNLGGRGLRFRSFADARAYALANMSQNPRWSTARKAEAERGESVVPVKLHADVKRALLGGRA